MTLKEIAEKYLATWSLYNPNNDKIATRDCEGYIWLGYKRRPLLFQSQLCDHNHFGVNIVQETFFVLSIYIEESKRGKGHGANLYRVLEAIAKEFGCSKVQMMPSGWTYRGESRKEYLLRREYREFEGEVVKDLI